MAHNGSLWNPLYDTCPVATVRTKFDLLFPVTEIAPDEGACVHFQSVAGREGGSRM